MAEAFRKWLEYAAGLLLLPARYLDTRHVRII